MTSNPAIINIMLDLETLGTKPGCKILAIGATVFGGDSRVKYNDFEVYIYRNLQGSLIEESSTLIWWETQDQEAKDRVLNNNSVILLEEALQMFTEWVMNVSQTAGVPAPSIRVWGNAASFDCKILEAAYREFGAIPPWSYRSEMCYRTWKNLFPEIEPDPFQGVKHTPLADAQFQAAHAEKIAKALRLEL